MWRQDADRETKPHLHPSYIPGLIISFTINFGQISIRWCFEEPAKDNSPVNDSNLKYSIFLFGKLKIFSYCVSHSTHEEASGTSAAQSFLHQLITSNRILISYTRTSLYSYCVNFLLFCYKPRTIYYIIFKRFYYRIIFSLFLLAPSCQAESEAEVPRGAIQVSLHRIARHPHQLACLVIPSVRPSLSV